MLDNDECFDIYKTLSHISWENTYSFYVPDDILKMISIYSTGQIISCKNINCSDRDNELLLMHSPDKKKKYTRWYN